MQPAAAKITLQIDTLSSMPDLRVGHETWIRYDVQTTLAVTFPQGGVLTIQAPAVFYFKQEPTGSGIWKLAEWKDEPSVALAGRGFERDRSLPRNTGLPTPASVTTWGRLRVLYQ